MSPKILRNGPKILIKHQEIKFSISLMSAATLLGPNLVTIKGQKVRLLKSALCSVICPLKPVADVNRQTFGSLLFSSTVALSDSFRGGETHLAVMCLKRKLGITVTVTIWSASSMILAISLSLMPTTFCPFTCWRKKEKRNGTMRSIG